LHNNGCGLASHLGVLVDIPTIGVGKTIFFVDGLRKDTVLDFYKKDCKKAGDNIKLVGESGRCWGAVKIILIYKFF